MSSPRVLPIIAYYDDLAEIIANPPQNRPFARAVGMAGRRACDRLSARGSLRAGPGLPNLDNLLMGACAPYWEQQNYSPPVSTTQYPVGKCPVDYTLTWNVPTRATVRCDNGQREEYDPTTWTTTVAGPVDSLTIEPVLGSCSDGQSMRGKRVMAGLAGAAPVQVLIGLTGFQSQLKMDWPDSDTLTLTRVDGLPDECGEPVFGVPLPGPNPAPDPIDYPDPELPYDDPVTGPLLPIPDLPSFPGFPAIPWRNPFKRVEYVPGDPGEPGPTETVDGSPEADPDYDPDAPPVPDEIEGDAPPGYELVALKIQILRSPPRARQYAKDIYRAVCYAYMGTVAGLDQDFAGASLRDGQLIYAETTGLTKFLVAANIAYRLAVTPFYREVN